MSTTVSMENIPTNPVDVSVHRFTTGDFKYRLSSVPPANGEIVAEYIYLGGDPTVETTATYRTSFDKEGVKRSSLRLRTIQKVTTDSVVTEIAPIDVIVSWNTPGVYEDPAAVMKMIGCAFGLTFGTLSSKVPQNEVVNAINRGNINAILS